MNRYYNTNFDYSQAQRVESIGTSAYMVWRTTWECAGMFDEPLGQFMVDPAYNFTLSRRGYAVWYTPCAEVVSRHRELIEWVRLLSYKGVGTSAWSRFAGDLAGTKFWRRVTSTT